MTPQTIEGSVEGKSPNCNLRQLRQEPLAHFVIGSWVANSRGGSVPQ